MNFELELVNISVLNIGYAKTIHRWGGTDISSPFARLYYVRSGRAKLHFPDRDVDLQPGCISYQVLCHTVMYANQDLNSIICSFTKDMATKPVSLTFILSLIWLKEMRLPNYCLQISVIFTHNSICHTPVQKTSMHILHIEITPGDI